MEIPKATLGGKILHEGATHTANYDYRFILIEREGEHVVEIKRAKIIKDSDGYSRCSGQWEVIVRRVIQSSKHQA